jgi:hypothetical protein
MMAATVALGMGMVEVLTIWRSHEKSPQDSADAFSGKALFTGCGGFEKTDDAAGYFRLGACPIIQRLKALTGVAPASLPGVTAMHHHPETCAVFSILFLKIDCMRSDA